MDRFAFTQRVKDKEEKKKEKTVLVPQPQTPLHESDEKKKIKLDPHLTDTRTLTHGQAVQTRMKRGVLSE